MSNENEKCEWEPIENGTCVHCGAELDQYINTESGDIEPLICYRGVCMMTPEERIDYEFRMEYRMDKF